MNVDTREKVIEMATCVRDCAWPADVKEYMVLIEPMLRNYAATLDKPADAGVTESEVLSACAAYEDWGRKNNGHCYAHAASMRAALESFAARHARQGDAVPVLWAVSTNKNPDTEPLFHREQDAQMWCDRWINAHPEMVSFSGKPKPLPLYTHPPAQPEQAKAGDWDAVREVVENIKDECGEWNDWLDALTAALPTTKGEGS